MAESKALWALLRQAADPTVADALETAVETAPDRTLCRINPLAFAASHELGEEPVIRAFCIWLYPYPAFLRYAAHSAGGYWARILPLASEIAS
jgi:hypothetical protein